MEVIQSFRQTVLRYSIVAIGVTTAIAYIFNAAVAKGLFLIGVTNLLLFWGYTRTLLVANPATDGLKSHTSKWGLIRFAAYATAAYTAYKVDPLHLRGLFGAVAALLLIRIVMMVVGITGIDQKKVATWEK